MDKGNVLVIGNSGVGKSTLINAVIGEQRAETSWGTTGTTKKLNIYESEEAPFRVIDTVGFEPSLIKEFRAINAVKKWSKEAAKKGDPEKKINIIWFCVDGTSRKLFEKTIKDLSMATKIWESVPIIVVITKSYSIPERQENIEMVHNAFAKQKTSKNLKAVIPVVASTYVLNETAFAPPEGITELISCTNEYMPEGIKAADTDIFSFKLKRKNVLSQGMIGTATSAGVVVGAVSIPFSDGIVLSALEMGEVTALSKIYDIKQDEKTKKFINSIIEVGTVGAAAKTLISGIKMIPGLNIAGAGLNAVIAGVFVATLGEASKYLFEQIYLGNKTVEDIDWATKITESKFANDTLEKCKKILENINESSDNKSIANMIKAIFNL
ncbi:MAG: 50S ribosome-binding GTPase [Lachnospiraceae bacterium]|nr:50S ribosome-binding GTPase [Lachnospiraceae bacterium]